MAIRNAAKALIIQDGKVLLNKSVTSVACWWDQPKGAICYDMPGGGQNQYETLEEAVVRECLEETGYEVEIDRLAAIYEEISDNEECRKNFPNHAHKIHFVFICHPTGTPRREPTEEDIDMVGSEWIALDEVKSLPFYPTIFAQRWDEVLTGDRPVYLGCGRW